LQQQLKQLIRQRQWAELNKRCYIHCRTHPHDLDVWFTWGQASGRLGKFTEAFSCFSHILTVDPDNAGACYNLGKLFSLQGDFAQAEQYYRQAIELRTDLAEAYSNLGQVLYNRLKLREAEAIYHQALSYQPDYTNPHYHLDALAGEKKNKPQPGISFVAMMHNQLGIVQRKRNHIAAARASFQKAIELAPDYTLAHSNLLFLLSYHVLCRPTEMLTAHQAWDQRHGGAEKAATFTHLPVNDPDRRLRIGYVSPDFHQHAVNYFFEPLLAAHHRDRVEVYCYAEVNRPDAVTKRLAELADGWRSTVGMTDLQVARMVHEDRIDVLIDLAGHTGTRLPVFTYRPAPVQATYLGYLTTTGLATMDYWITDEVLHPPDTVELASETLYRLPRCCLAYQAVTDAPAPQARAGVPLTFGSFNQITKLSPETISLWSAILRRLPEARLLLKCQLLTDRDVAASIHQQFATHGIGAERLQLLSHTPSYQAHLAIYNQVDIALDTVPRTGGSTSTDALWMGTPLLTLAGERFIERLSATMLDAIGLPELIAESREDYIAKAVQLAGDPIRRASWHASLRQRMATSPLCDASGLATALEDAYQNMWQRCLHHAGQGAHD